MARKYLASCAIICATLAGFAAPAHAQDITTYDCRAAPTDEQLDVKLDPASGIGAYITKTGERSLVPDGEGGWTNVDGSVRFSPENDAPTLMYRDKPITCSVTDVVAGTPAEAASEGGEGGEATPDAAGGAIAVNLPGKSLGGRVRSGPGTDYESLGNLAENDAVEIIANTGVVFDGYTWFEIRFGDGQSGYQWGGVLCADGDAVDGLYGACQ